MTVEMAADGVAATVAAVHSPLTPPSPTGPFTTMASLPTDLPGSCNVTYADKFDSRLLWYEDHIVGSFLVLVGIISLLGNGATIVMFYRKLRHLTAAEVLLLNMAIMHLCLAICSHPCSTISSYAHRWLFGDVGCQIYGFVCYTLGVATIVSMVALAVVRYLKTCTHTYSRTLTAQHMKVVLLVVYLYSFFWSILPFLSVPHAYEVEPFGTSCTLHWTSDAKAMQVYILVVVVMVVVVPFVVMSWCYVEILLLVRRNHRKKVIMAKRSGHSQGRTELQLTLVSALVCLGYMVAWFPYTVVSVFYGLLRREGPVYLTLAPVLLAKSSCAYNPIIYIFVNSRYRQQMMGILSEAFQTLLCCGASSNEDTAQQAPDTSVDMKSSRTFAMNQESIVMDEVQPLDHLAAPSTQPLSIGKSTTLASLDTTLCHDPQQASQNSEGEAAASLSLIPQTQECNVTTDDNVKAPQMSTTLGTTILHPLHGFSGTAEKPNECEASSDNFPQP